MKRGPKPKPDHLKKAKPMSFRLSHITIDKLSRIVKARLAKDKTEAVERALDKWEI